MQDYVFLFKQHGTYGIVLNITNTQQLLSISVFVEFLRSPRAPWWVFFAGLWGREHHWGVWTTRELKKTSPKKQMAWAMLVACFGSFSDTWPNVNNTLPGEGTIDSAWPMTNPCVMWPSTQTPHVSSCSCTLTLHTLGLLQ